MPYSLADLKRDLGARGLRLMVGQGTLPLPVATATPTAAPVPYSTTGQVEYLDGGYISRGVNEVSLISTIDDPTKLRQGVTGTHTIYGSQSAGRVDSSNVQREKVLILYREDDDTLGHDGGCVEIFLQRPDTDDDANMIRCWRITTNYYEPHVALKGSTGEAGGGGAQPLPTDKLLSINGTRQLNLLDDGRLVIYRQVPGGWVDDRVL
jgi:hypothetical protein